MEKQGRPPGLDPAVVRHRLDVEIGEVRAAILLVSSGTSSRIRLIGLAFGDELVAELRGEALRAGVALVPEFRPDDAGCDISVVARDD